ncbi:EAL domain-containing protein [Parasphingorhabdus sp.]|uniref:EAL domain-containing protein n=1 Tax=Parasphingorhabdus sp. TaxID=2709688 RepID=UPI00300170AF
MKTILSYFKAAAFRHFLAAWLLAFLVGLALIWGEIGNDAERRLDNIRAGLLETSASGEIVIVEIDAESLHALDRWPWPRAYYAEAVSKLNKAGAAQIAFDIDFSSRSDARNDQLFAESLAKSDATVILPTMRQQASMGKEAFVESLPIGPFREHVFLASVNVHPDSRGELNRYSYGTTTAGVARPSLASMVAESAGDIDESFAIDQSIDPATIPRLSFIDLFGEKDLSPIISGKKILIGATAIELGDRYPISRFGIVPGVVIQALAAETLIQQTNLPSFGKFLALLLSAILILICITTRIFSSRTMIGIAVGTSVVLLTVLYLADAFNLFTFSTVPALAFLTVYVLLQKFLSTTSALKVSRFLNEMSGFPNEAAMAKSMPDDGSSYTATARIADFRELLVLTDMASRQDLFQNLAKRLSFLARDEQIYHIDSDMVAWIVKSEYAGDMKGHFDTAIALLQAPVMAGDTKIKIDAIFGVSNGSLDESRSASEQAAFLGTKWAWHDKQFDKQIGEKHSLLLELDQAVKDGALGVVYQPKWDLKANCLDGAEALVRWHHPQHGMVSPEIFIPMLEKAGRIDALTIYVLDRALKDLASWRRPRLSCSVNVSAMLLGDQVFVEKAIAMVTDAPPSNAQIVFEVTETAALADPEKSIAALKKIEKAGIRISIDDYGTGQSTLSYLQKLPVSEIKLDQSFVKTMTRDKANRVMVKSTIKMAHDLGFKIVAEGIEDQASMNLLTRYGCDIGQGWHISKPVTSETFAAEWLDRGVEKVRLSA